MRILFLGDVVGISGCSKLTNNLLNEIDKNKIDFVIVNGENAAVQGVGLTKEICMDFFEWTNKDPSKSNKYGIAAPTLGKKIYPDIIFVPLVAFDDDLNRLGYGGGFYDRYLEKISKIKKIFKIGLGFSYQEIKKIPINKYDKKLDLIITEKKIIQ